MNWTTEKPKQVGWYWHREDGEDYVVLLIIGEVWFMGGRREKLRNVNGEWSSEPIPMPEDK
jgi:hypothetical protein